MPRACPPRLVYSWFRLIIVLLAGVMSAQAMSCTKSVRWESDPPYDIQAEDGPVQGATADLLREILSRMGCQPRFVELPWARGLRNLQTGSLDMLPRALKTTEREAFALFSNPIHNSANVLFMSRQAAQDFSFQSLEELSHSTFRLGIQIGVVYGSEYAELLKQPQFRERTLPINDRRGAWLMLKAGRLDGLIADEVTGLLELQQLGLRGEIVRSSLVISEEPVRVAFSRRSTSQDFVERFNATLDDVLADGTYERIARRYLPCPVAAVDLGCRKPITP